MAGIKNPKDRVEIGIVGKYVDLRESYKSLHEALVHGGMANERPGGPQLHRLRGGGAGRARGPARATSTASWCPAASASGASKARSPAIRYAREQQIPYFGICFGMQLAVIEFARHLAGLTNATERGIRTRRRPSR